jgi:hypothetical protein
MIDLFFLPLAQANAALVLDRGVRGNPNKQGESNNS